MQSLIRKADFNPQSGHEQAGYRLVLVISNNFFNQKTNLTIVCPVTDTSDHFPLHIPLDSRTVTTGAVLCEHVKALDLKARPCKVVEQLPKDLLDKVVGIVFSEIEILPEDD